MNYLKLVVMILWCTTATAQTVRVRVGTKDFCGYVFNPDKKILVVARSLPANGRITLSGGAARRVNDSQFVVSFPPNAPQVQTMSVYAGHTLLQSCTIKVGNGPQASFTFGGYKSGDSISVADLMTLPTLAFQSNSGPCKIIDYVLEPYQKGRSEYYPAFNYGATLSKSNAKSLQSLNKGWRLIFESIEMTCKGKKQTNSDGSFVLFIK